MRSSAFQLRSLALAIFLVLGFLAFRTMVCAAAPPAGITVSPAFQMVSIEQNEPSHPLKFMVTDHESHPVTINLSTQDFSTLNETGGLIFVGSNPTQLQKKYGLAKWLSLSQKQVTVQPGQTVAVTASILNLSSLAPGGHYGALMLSLGGTNQTSGGVSLRPIASSLLFVTKIGGDTHKLSLASVKASHNFYSLPSNVVLNFYNDGNTHVVPRGLVSITDSHGRLISKGIINENSDSLLPQTYRLLDVPLERVSGSPIGQYNLLVDFRFDGYNQFRRYQTNLWIFPIRILILIIIIVLLAVLSTIISVRRWRIMKRKNN